jgi:RNA polymerase sigma-70 factor, ECF subfamily
MDSNLTCGFQIVDCLAMREWPSESISDDALLVRAAREGDRSAFGQLYSRYAPMVHGILLTRVPPREVDDLVQEVFLRALPRLRSLRDERRFGRWLAAIARNRATDFYRQPRSAPQFVEGLGEEEIESRGRNDTQEAEARAILAVIRSLPEAYRETLILRLVQGMTGPEIAARTGLTEGSVRVNLHRGMQQLRAKLAHPQASAKEKGSGV